MKTLKTFTIGIILAASIVTSAQARSFSAIETAIYNTSNQLINYLNKKYDDTIQWINKELLFKENPSQVPAMVANTQLAKVRDIDATQTQALTQTTALKTATNTEETINFSGIPAADMSIKEQTSYDWATNTRKSGINLNIGNQSLSLESLLAPSAYPKFNPEKPYENPAYNFIQFSGYLFQPISTISLTRSALSPAKIQEIQSGPAYKQYRAALRAYAAAQSVGTSNLYQMFAKRIIQPGLGKAAGLPNANDASQLQVEQYLATRRGQSAKWYEDMAKAPPATIQRETLFVLVEMQQQLLALQQQNERLLATISVMQMQQNQQNAKTNLEPLEKEVKNQINPPKKRAGSSAGSAAGLSQ